MVEQDEEQFEMAEQTSVKTEFNNTNVNISYKSGPVSVDAADKKINSKMKDNNNILDTKEIDNLRAASAIATKKDKIKDCPKTLLIRKTGKSTKTESGNDEWEEAEEEVEEEEEEVNQYHYKPNDLAVPSTRKTKLTSELSQPLQLKTVAQ